MLYAGELRYGEDKVDINIQDLINQNQSDNRYLPLMWFSNLFNMGNKKTFPAIVFESTEDGFVFSFNSDNISKNGFNANPVGVYMSAYAFGRELSDRMGNTMVGEILGHPDPNDQSDNLNYYIDQIQHLGRLEHQSGDTVPFIK